MLSATLFVLDSLRAMTGLSVLEVKSHTSDRCTVRMSFMRKPVLSARTKIV